MATVTEEILGVETVELDEMGQTPIVTTLYDLIATLQDQVEPWEEDLVTEAVVDLCNTGHLSFVNLPQNCEIVCT